MQVDFLTMYISLGNILCPGAVPLLSIDSHLGASVALFLAVLSQPEDVKLFLQIIC